jgi:hypothetical protein
MSRVVRHRHLAAHVTLTHHVKLHRLLMTILGRLPKRAVGSTLLLKGLEAEVAVVLDAANLDARNLYVAMTRGSKKLIICSETPVLNID